ncbi:chromosome segregation protein SMC [Tessaracoccus flavus]|uniref:Chromosome partition protein Smc n=1 Tax=Tessaracoccus flavus TaxID=1610493 RepID=A0A1Q2CFG9_9ACTN|nr:chromosome segregation protein SMC [Tessaracoccus flavus]AQP44853.1 chromosome segregation protein SMC [Tessaracoccus flavus]SDY97142.1 condensin subunit Smc [Tessaracoccus flavus]
MYLKQLTLRGFKSFASATTLIFEPGITCVVGPNGSGKSNVVDALSWVMGEQGAKSLRGGKMEDVIFAGTAKRAPLGRAEVELTIDNSDGALPIEYAEVTITRTMFRSGGSEYAINGSPARLLDVQELLSDSGIGREMHVIVGQGQLDAILQATPESRRGFIEEAAGVLKHRKRKEKALRKLEATKANLERLGDLVGELQRQLKPLGRQAQAARKAAVIQAELRDAKARLLADDLAAAQAKLAAELADEAAALELRGRAERAVEEALAAEEAAERRLRAASAEFNAAQEQWYALAALRERVTTTMSISAERMRAGDNQPVLDVGGRDPEALEAEAATIRAREQELRRDVEAANAALTDASLRRSGAEQAHSAAEQAYSAALRAIADRREGLARLTGRVNSIRSRLEASDEEIQRLGARRDEALARAEESARRYHQTESSLAGLGASESDLDEDYEKAAALVETLEADAAQLRHREAEIGRRRAGLEARVEALRLLTERRDGSADLLDRGDALGRLGDLISVEPGWEAAVSAALRGMAEAVVVQGLDGAVDATRFLADGERGRAPLVIAGTPAAETPDFPPASVRGLVDGPPSISGALDALLAGAVAVETADDAVSAVSSDPSLLAVTRAGDLYSAWMAEGGSAAQPSLLEVHAELAEAERALAEAGHELDQLKFAAEQVRGSLEEATRAEETALAQLHDSDAQLAAVAEQLNSFRQGQASATREAERLAEAMDAARAARTRDEEQLEELTARLAAASAEGDLEEPDPAERDAKAGEARRARQAEMDARLALRTAEEQVKAIAGRADSLQRAAASERQSRAKARARAEQLRREADVARVVNTAAQTLAEYVEAARQRAAAQRDAAEQARRTAESGTTQARHATKAASARLDEIVRGAHRDEMVRIEHKMRIEQLSDKALSELGLEPDQLVAEYGPDQPVPVITRPDGTALTDDDQPEPVPYDREKQTSRLRAAERNLAVLGRVNPLALEEFEAMTARHQFLAEQLDDLKQTRADLIEIVDQVDKRVQEVFEAAYRDVEKSFHEVFARLFPGGEGRLVLTEPGDWLTTGVDVEARPAGKQIKRLSLLSGGERSLVAVAFLVSLFIARPSPFYILDEVEAALDDANLGRLLGIYEELRASSQLLIITHQKRTMEIADSLYGVSMRGDGISTVVSQRLHTD